MPPLRPHPRVYNQETGKGLTMTAKRIVHVLSAAVIFGGFPCLLQAAGEASTEDAGEKAHRALRAKVVMLESTVKRQNARIEALEAEIAALKAELGPDKPDESPTTMPAEPAGVVTATGQAKQPDAKADLASKKPARNLTALLRVIPKRLIPRNPREKVTIMQAESIAAWFNRKWGGVYVRAELTARELNTGEDGIHLSGWLNDCPRVQGKYVGCEMGVSLPATLPPKFMQIGKGSIVRIRGTVDRITRDPTRSPGVDNLPFLLQISDAQVTAVFKPPPARRRAERDNRSILKAVPRVRRRR